MRYLGMDVHATSTTWCLLDDQGTVVREGRVATTASALQALARELTATEEVVAGHEVGTLTYLVHDTLTAVGLRVLAFNAQQLRMIAASRKKTDRRDAYWLAKALHSGMHPHPVYIPPAPIRTLRTLLSRRHAVVVAGGRWRTRARAYVRAAGLPVPRGAAALRAQLARGEWPATSSVPLLAEGLALCQRQAAALRVELAQLDAELAAHAAGHEAIGRLQTVPGIGFVVATTIYAWVGDVHRFPSAKVLAAYAGVVPSVRQSGARTTGGAITKQGAPVLRAILVQAAHAVLRSRRAEAAPLRALGQRIRTARGRRKIAVVALARHLLRLAYYLLRDGTTYDATRLGGHMPTAA
jgi:transposase